MTHALDKKVFVNEKAKPMLNTILTLCLAKINLDPIPLLKEKRGSGFIFGEHKVKIVFNIGFAFTFTKTPLSRAYIIFGSEKVKKEY